MFKLLTALAAAAVFASSSAGARVTSLMEGREFLYRPVKAYADPAG